MSDAVTITTIKEYGSLIGVDFAMYEVQALCAISRLHNKAMQHG